MMYTPIKQKDFQIGDLIRVIEDWPSDAKDHEVTAVESNHITIKYLGAESVIRYSRDAFKGSSWSKRITEVAYDPNQMVSEEDDL